MRSSPAAGTPSWARCSKHDLNVLILGREIDITGLVRGRNITVKAKDDDSHELKIVDNDLNDEGGLSVELSFMDFSTDARLTVASTASLIASETIDLSVESRQTKPLIPTFEELLGNLGGVQKQARF